MNEDSMTSRIVAILESERCLTNWIPQHIHSLGHIMVVTDSRFTIGIKNSSMEGGTVLTMSEWGPQLVIAIHLDRVSALEELYSHLFWSQKDEMKIKLYLDQVQAVFSTITRKKSAKLRILTRGSTKVKAQKYCKNTVSVIKSQTFSTKLWAHNVLTINRMDFRLTTSPIKHSRILRMKNNMALKTTSGKLPRLSNSNSNNNSSANHTEIPLCPWVRSELNEDLVQETTNSNLGWVPTSTPQAAGAWLRKWLRR